MTAKPSYKRVILKMSGEILMGSLPSGIDNDVVQALALEIAEVHALGAEIGIVIGGGNIFRGLKGVGLGVERVSADQMGMLATIINGLAIQNALEKCGVFTRLMSAIRMDEICEPFIKRRAVRHLEKGRIVIFAAGTGNPYFTTDTAAALRAMEIRAQALLKATKVDGIYSANPEEVPDAVRFDELSYKEFLHKDLRVMDGTAITLCQENDMPVIVFNLNKKGNIQKVICGERIGSMVTKKGGGHD